MSARIKQLQLDASVREGFEYAPSYWDLILSHRRLHTLELKLEYAYAQEEYVEFRRKVLDNDQPGRRHMLPFAWQTSIGADRVRRHFQVPVRAHSAAFDRMMWQLRDKADNARRAWQTAKLAEGKEV